MTGQAAMQPRRALQAGWICTTWTKAQLLDRRAQEAGSAGGYRFYWPPKPDSAATLLAVREHSSDFAAIWDTGLFAVPELPGG